MKSIHAPTIVGLCALLLGSAFPVLPAAAQSDEAKAHYLRGVGLRRAAKYEEAVEAFTEAVDLHEGYLDALEERAWCNVQLFEPKRALEDINAVLAVDSDHLDIQLVRADLHYEMDEWETALTLYEKLADAHPDRAEPLVGKAQVLQMLDRDREAAAAIENAIAIDEDDAEALEVLADLQRARGEYAKAIETINRAMEQAPAHAKPRLHRAGILAAAGQDEAAAAAFEAAIEHAKHLASAYAARAAFHYHAYRPEESKRDAQRALEHPLRKPRSLAFRAVIAARAGLRADANDDLKQLQTLLPDSGLLHCARASVLRIDGQFAAAEAANQLALEIVKRPSTRLQRARILRESKRYDEARSILDDLVADRPDFYSARIARALVRDAAGQDDAKADCAAALEIYPRRFEALSIRATLHEESGDPESALADLDRAIETNPGYLFLVSFRAVLRHVTGDEEGAAKDVAKLGDEKERFARGYANSLDRLIRRGKLDVARRYCRYALFLDPESASALSARAQLHMRSGDTKRALTDMNRAVALAEDDMNVRFDRAYLLSGLGRFSDAIKDLDRVLRKYPDAHGSLALRAHARFNLLKYAEAKQDLDRAIELAPEMLRYRQQRAVQCVWRSDWEGAIRSLDRILRISPRRGDAYALRALAKAQLHGEESAGEDLDRALEFVPRTVRHALDACRLLENLGRGEDAMTLVNAVLKRTPKNIESLEYRCWLYDRVNNTEKALAEAARLIELAPERRYAREVRIRIFTLKGKFDEAVEECNALIKREPKYVFAYVQRGYAAMGNEDNEDAMADFDRAIELDQKCVKAYVYRAYLYLLEEEFEDALEDLNQAIELDDKNVTAYRYRYRVRLALDDEEGAAFDLKRWRELSRAKPKG